jgi:hypothetical protein
MPGDFHVSAILYCLSKITLLTNVPKSGGYIVSAIFTCWEYQRLGFHYRQQRVLRISFWIKLLFIFVEVGLAIAFGVLADRDHYNGAAVCEWVVSLVYTFYVWSFAIDFLPAVMTKHYASKETELGMATAMEEGSRERGYNGSAQEQAAYANGGYTNGRVANGVEYPNPQVPRAEASRNF